MENEKNKNTEAPSPNMSQGEHPVITGIRNLRIMIDVLINSTGMLNPSREISLTHTNLQRSKAWLGMVLGELGTKTPYQASTDHTSRVIEGQAEHTGESLYAEFMNEGVERTQTAYVKAFRAKIDQVQKLYGLMYNDLCGYPDDSKGTWWYDHFRSSWNALIEAKHWLGWELNRIKNEQDWVAAGSPSTPGQGLMAL